MMLKAGPRCSRLSLQVPPASEGWRSATAEQLTERILTGLHENGLV